MIPRFAIQHTTIANSYWEAEGWLLQVQWFGIVVEFTVAKVCRSFGR